MKELDFDRMGDSAVVNKANTCRLKGLMRRAEERNL